MRITVLGAAGNMGRRIMKEARNRGHKLTAVVRHGSDEPLSDHPLKIIQADATDADDVQLICCNTEVVVAATRPQPGSEHELVKTTALLLKTLSHSATRLLISDGADELLIDDSGRSVISMEDMAVALLDEIERPRHIRRRFTVGY